MQKIARIEAPLLLSGINPGLENDSAPLWVNGENVVFRDGAIRPEPGQLLIYNRVNSNVRVLGIGESEREGHPILWWADKNKIFRADMTVTPFTSQVTQQYASFAGREDESKDGIATTVSLAAWGEWMVAANGIDEMVYRDTAGLPGGSFALISAIAGFTQPDGVPVGVKFRPHFLVRAGSHMMANMHHRHTGSPPHNEVPEGEQTVWWCSQNDLAAWKATRANSAGSFILRDATGPFTAAIPFLDGEIVSTLNSIHVIRFIGDPLWFGVARSLFGIGSVSAKGMVNHGSIIYGMGPQGFWRTDGAQFEFIDTPYIRDYVYKNFNDGQKSKVVAWLDASEERIVWFLPFLPNTELSHAVGYSLKDGTWHLPGYIRTAASPGGPFGFGITGDDIGSIYRQTYQSTGVASSGDIFKLAEGLLFFSGYGFGGYGYLGYGGKYQIPIVQGTGLYEGSIQLYLQSPTGSIINLGISADTSTLFLESKDLNLGDSDVAKILRAARLELQPIGASGLLFKIYSRDNLDDPLVLEGTFASGASDEILHMRTNGRRYFRFRLEDTGSFERWKITAIELFGVIGRKRLD